MQGSAVEFAQVVTQIRNIDDTGLETVGDTARRWMEIAQCFAGGPEMPPAKGVRGGCEGMIWWEIVGHRIAALASFFPARWKKPRK